MPLRYVLDEHFRGILWSAFQHHNAKGIDVVDVVRVGDPVDLPRGTPDPELLLWAEREGRVVVSLDRSTMPGHLAAHLALQHRSPGIFVLRLGHPLPLLVSHLALAAHLYDPDEVRDQIRYLP
jgi:hypothetical protein